MSDIAKHLKDLSAEKRELFELLLKEKKQRKDSAVQQAIPQRAVGADPVPVSFGQQRLWFLEQWEPGNVAYNLLQAVRLTGRPNIAALQQSFNQIVQRHEALRTTFTALNGVPVQNIASTLMLDIPIVDLSAHPSSEQAAIVRQHAVIAARRPFDLAHDPLLRATLLRLSEAEHVLLITMHHIISDGWSHGVLFRELATLYTAYAAEKPLTLPPLPIQYADFAIWQRERLQGELLEQQLGYWKRQLEGAPPVLELPTDRPRPASLTFDGARHYLTLPKGLAERLKALSQQEGVSLFMTLLAAFNVLLYRYTEQEDIVVGSPIANRNRSEIEGLIGFFVNTLVMRNNVSGNPTFRALLGRVRDVALGAYAHQDVPFEKLVEDLDVERNSSHSPLFQVVFVLQNAPLPDVQLPGMTLSLLEVDNGIAQFDLMLELYEGPNGLQGSFQYNTNLFDAATIDRMQLHFHTLLEGIVADPDRRLSALPLLGAGEQRQILMTWNATQTDYPRDACIHDLFEAQVVRTPDAVAVVFGEQQLTYRELNQQANQVARHLKTLGIGAGDLVAVYMSRSLEMIPALLGILKAGGAYVPLETNFPPARIQWILSSLQIRCLLTQSDHAPSIDALAEQTSALEHLICLDAVELATSDAVPSAAYRVWSVADLRKLPDENLPPQNTPDDTAYIIFTSGSTGTPKGVVVRHRPVINLIDWVNRTFAIQESDRVLFVTSLCFDLSVYDIFGLLAAGGSIQVVSDQDIREPEQLLRLLYEKPITFWDSAPAMLQQLVPFFPAAQANPQISSLRLVFLSGDWIPVTLPDMLRATFPSAHVISLGGATEATVWSNYYPIGVVDPQWNSIPYGKPIQNAQYYILDQQLNPCPIGVPGDLYIGGECLASGYANEPTLTAEKFIPDPFRSEPGAKLYKTGDRARFWPDGTMEFLGRRDHQVKIRGFRVELGEIEAVLSQHPAVRNAVVVAHATDRFRRDIYLAAYVIAHPQQTLDVAELRRYVQKRLPEYMTPGAFVILDEIPVTANGKVDRKALPEPERGRAEMTTVYVTPRNSIEDTIAGIWTEVLEIDRVGVYDNFFELGGHSLLATQVISRVQGTFQVDLPLRALFDGPTVANLANRVDIARAEKQGMRVPPIAPIAWDDGVALSLAQERLWLIDQFVPGNTAYISTGAARIRGPLDEEILERCFQEVIRRHAILRTNFHATRPLQFIHDQRPFSLNKVDLRALPPDERETHATRIAVQQAQHPFTLSEGTLMRVSLIRIEDEDYLLALATHHIIYDLMSIGIYIREMRALYEAFVQGKPSPLPELPVQYADFADWQQRWMQQEVMAAQLPYWKEQLRGANMVLELPTDRPRPPIPSFRGVRHSFGLSPELTKALRELGHKEGVTPFMLLLAAFDVLLYRYSGQDDIIVGSPVANRNRTEIEGVIGFFVNILSLRTDMSGNPTFRELVGRVREVCLGAYMHQDLPFARLVEELQPERDLSRNPIFQVVFNFLHNYMMPVPNLMDLSLELLRVHAATEQFDLTLDFWERPEGLQGSIDYNTDLFDEPTIARMVEHLIALLDQITANPDVRITNVELMREAERRLVLAEWSSSAGAPVQELCVHELFEQQVERAPAVQAVVYEDHALSYAELNQRANQLAHYLRERGVGPEVIVGICVERSLDMIVGLLGILKAGGAYLPLDPLYPRERLAFMLEDAGAAALVTQHDLLGGLPQHPAHTICLDTDWAQIAHYSTDNPSVRIAPDHPAYIIYTSGSTGKPKGAVIPHRALSNYTQVATVAYNLTPEDRVLQFASISFDASAEEIYPTLTSGAALVLRTDAMLSSVTTFLHMCRTWGLTIIDLPTTYWHELVVGAEAEALLLPESLRLVIIGGERALPERLAAWQRIAGAGVQLVNTYGPTEATIVATMYSVPPLDSDELREIPIGRAIPQGQTYILDQRLQPTPIGVPGELYIGGAGLARGYLQRPALTAVAFVPDSFSSVPGARLYKTGDLARYLPNGQIEFVGRADHQVKIRGFRIELDEIAAALDQHLAVQESLVVAREEGGGAKRLVAYVVPTAGQTPTTSELYSFLKERLPGYMVPAAFVTLEALPLTPNGKIDRRVLPAPDQTRPELERAYVAPRNAIEEVLSGMWAEALGVEQVGVYDNFFELGGHSLLATQLISQVRELFQIEVTLHQLFQEPHVAGLSEALARDPGAADRIEKTAQLVLRLAQVSDDDLENTLGQHA